MIVERILQFIDLKGIKKSEFYRKTNLSNGFLDKVKDVGVSKLDYILKAYPEISLEWLVSGEGDMFSVKKYDSSSAQMVHEGIQEYGLKRIPLVYGSAIGGFGGSHFAIGEADVKEYYVVPKFKNKQIDFMIEVEGSSMYPKYNSGDVVACRIINESSFIQWNKTHVVATKDQGILLKRIKPSKTEERVTMISDNKDYDAFEVPMAEISGLAIVVGVIRLE